MIAVEHTVGSGGATFPLDGIGELPELTVGWAVWTIRDGHLRSVTEPLTWPSRHPVLARCGAARHVAPAPDCGCGVRALTETAAADAVRRHDGEPVLVGCVALCGRVEDADGPAPGWRAKRAYPLFVIADDHTRLALRRELAASYGIPAYRAHGGVGSLFEDRRQVVWWMVRNRLQAELDRTPAASSVPATVTEVLDSVVTTWTAAELWRHDRTWRPAAGATTSAPSGPAAPTPAAPTTVPDLAGIVVAWRSWNLAGDRLMSVTRTDPWSGREAMVARCARGSGHRVPDRTCSCGVYAAREIDYAARYHAAGGGASVFGCVALWGDLVEASYGWRAEKAYPLVLFAPATVSGTTRRALERAYGVPVHRADAHGFGPAVVRAGEDLRGALERDHGRVAGSADLEAFLAITRPRGGSAAVHTPGPTTPPGLPPPYWPTPAPTPGLVARAADRVGLEWSRITAVGTAFVLAAVALAICLAVHG